MCRKDKGPGTEFDFDFDVSLCAALVFISLFEKSWFFFFSFAAEMEALTENEDVCSVFNITFKLTFCNNLILLCTILVGVKRLLDPRMLCIEFNCKRKCLHVFLSKMNEGEGLLLSFNVLLSLGLEKFV